MRVYLDTSAAAKMLQPEAESAAMARFVERDDVELVSTLLLETELRRLAIRGHINQLIVTHLLNRVTFCGLEDIDYVAAGLLPGETRRSLDALHVQGALALGVDYVATYDTRMASACAQVGLPVIQPGTPDSFA